MDEIVPVVFILAAAFVVVGVTRIVSDGRTRRRLIQAGASPELARAVTAPPGRDPALQDALKWGLVIGAVGLALILVQFLPYGPGDPIVFGLVLLFGAAGLLGYYAAARRVAAGT